MSASVCLSVCLFTSIFPKYMHMSDLYQFICVRYGLWFGPHLAALRYGTSGNMDDVIFVHNMPTSLQRVTSLRCRAQALAAGPFCFVFCVVAYLKRRLTPRLH